MACEAADVIGKNVVSLRTKAGMTQQELAAKCSIAQARVSEIERGHANPTVETLEIIASALGVEITKFFRGIKQRVVA